MPIIALLQGRALEGDDPPLYSTLQQEGLEFCVMVLRVISERPDSEELLLLWRSPIP